MRQKRRSARRKGRSVQRVAPWAQLAQQIDETTQAIAMLQLRAGFNADLREESGTPEDDDRSAVTFWLPKSAVNLDALHKAFTEAASIVFRTRHNLKPY